MSANTRWNNEFTDVEENDIMLIKRSRIVSVELRNCEKENGTRS